MAPRPSRRLLDTWFPTLARYCGLGLLVYAVLVDRGRLLLENPALLPAIAGLIFLKNVINGKGGDG